MPIPWGKPLTFGSEGLGFESLRARRSSLSASWLAGIVPVRSQAVGTPVAGRGRPELAAREDAELAVLGRYLPAPLSEQDVAAMVEDVVAGLAAQGVTGMPAMGRAMKEGSSGPGAGTGDWAASQEAARRRAETGKRMP